MFRIMCMAIFIFMTTFAHAGQKAITDTGEEVILNDDGTWTFVNNENAINTKIITNTMEFRRPESSNFLLKSTNNNSAFWIDTNKWIFKKATTNDSAEYEFRLKDYDLYGMAITEAVYIPVESLVDIALTNAKSAAPDFSIVKKEYRHVNGHKVIFMEMKGTLQGMDITYYGYYYSDKSGSTQFVTYTGTNLIGKYLPEITSMLNGLVVQ